MESPHPEARRQHGSGRSLGPTTVIVQSLPETVQVLRPPGTWTVPGAFFLRPRPASLLELLRMSEPPVPPGAERLIRWIMAAIVVWGAFHAFGAWQLNHDVRRPLIVLGCVAAFLGFWLVMLSIRSRRTSRR